MRPITKRQQADFLLHLNEIAIPFAEAQATLPQDSWVVYIHPGKVAPISKDDFYTYIYQARLITIDGLRITGIIRSFPQVMRGTQRCKIGNPLFRFC